MNSPAVPLYGVDFSGGREKNGRNAKLWVASWSPDGSVSLEWGGDEQGFGREALAGRIAASRGVWLLDFPFGPEARIAEAMGWRHWEEYLAWARSDAEATVLRDAARERVEARGLRWSARRRVDAHLGTTWFPFFQQLYRQTLRGAADVLAPLAASPDVRVLPWQEPFDDPGRGAQVVEGFPGLAIARLGLPAAGYKGKTDTHRQHRRAILDALARTGLPCPADVRRTALDDPEGDALDALVLLSSAAKTAERPASHWAAIRERSETEGWAVEGWFFD